MVGVMGVTVGVANFFWGQSIGIDGTKTFQLTFSSSMKIVCATDLGGLWALEWAWQTFFWLYEDNTFQSNFYSSIKTVEVTALGGLWSLEWARHIAETNLRCVRSSGICMPNLDSLALILSEISAFIRTDRQTVRRRDGHG